MASRAPAHADVERVGGVGEVPCLLHVGFGLFFGLLGYLLSMVCWYFALHRLPLSKAYALLSLSYILVWAAAIWLPGWHEPFYWQSLLGVAIIVAGVLTIFWPVKRR